MIRPLFERVLVKIDQPEEKSKGGIFLPEQAQEKPQIGYVFAIAPDCETVKVKQKVIFAKYTGTEVKIDGETYFLLKEDDILGVIE